jgi:hypothetical protein
MLGGQGHLADDLLEFIRGSMADRAFGGSLIALINITADSTDKLLHFFKFLS